MRRTNADHEEEKEKKMMTTLGSCTDHLLPSFVPSQPIIGTSGLFSLLFLSIYFHSDLIIIKSIYLTTKYGCLFNICYK